MKFFKKALKALLCTSLVVSIGVSATACSTDDGGDDGDNKGDNPGFIDTPTFTPPDDGSEGIDWSKYWDGVSSVDSSTDNFKFTGSKDIGTLTGDYTPTITPANEGEHVIVSFTDGVPAQSIIYGGTAVKPNPPEISGKMFVNWYIDSNFGTVYDFSSPVTSNLPLYAKWVDLPDNIESAEGNNESLAVNFSGSANTTVQYKNVSDSDWITVDKELVRAIDSSTARVDILGLAAGEYNVKIGETPLPAPVTVNKYDRSGYAHFNRRTSDTSYSGVGAYNDDGTLKDNALVIYVTDANKDTVMDEVCAANPDVPMFQIPGSDWKNKNASGIGWWLNNNQYTASNVGSDKNKVPSNTYDQANGGKLAFKAVDRPIVIRFIGTVTTPEGCTAYNDTKEGGGVGDNGHMARMKNLKNVTLEGVGDNAVIQGWGFHYVMGTDAKDGQGTSFEVRNLTFNEYPEDAIGMEGQQSGSKITAAVARCWIHHNTFLPGYCANPAESDKKEGDGSCDFKRGEYYTCSYNYFEWCHKTNLIGSSDSSLQYNISMHHNMWYNCGSRIPLLRQANCHFYNNYVCGDMTAKSPYNHISKPALSYVHSLRANSYMFSEANYYEGSKNVTDGKSGGAAKSWNDVTTQCFGTNTMAEATSRDQKVGNNCAYDGTNYSSFDTDSSLFYYDSENKTTNALLDDPVAARTRVLYEAGALGYEPPVSQQKTSSTPKNTSNITLPKDGKAKGEILVFALTGTTEVTLTTTTVDLYDNYGKVWFTNFSGTKTVILPKGTYVVASAQKDKEGYLTNIEFVEGEGNSEARVEAAKQALAAIPSTITLSSEYLIEDAKTAYGSLIGNEVDQIDAELLERYAKASAAYEELLVEYVVKRIEYIGEVTADSYVKINAAQTAYNKLSVTHQAKVTNYSTLTAAWTNFKGFAVTNVINRLNDLPDLTASDVSIKSNATVEKLYDWFNAVQDAYEDLNGDEDRRDEVPADSVKKLTDGYAELNTISNFLDFKASLAATSVENATTDGAKLVSLYNGLPDSYKAKITGDELTKFNQIKAAYDEYASKAVTCTFMNAPSSDLFKVTKGSYTSCDVTINGETLTSCLKIESSTNVEVTVGANLTLNLYVSKAGKIKIDGTDYSSATDASGNNVITVTLEAGTHIITKNTSFNLYMATLTPAA